MWLAADEDEIREIVQETVVHEVGHYFGLSDEEMEEWEAGGWRE
ncbi:MAG: metallopeptidase family protein [Nitrospirota bacterium]